MPLSQPGELVTVSNTTTDPETEADAMTAKRSAYRRRFGLEIDPSSAEWTPVIEQQFAHRSVRRFLPEPVGDATIETIVAAAQSASTSQNLHVWSVVAVRDHAMLQRLAELSYQPFIADAPLVLIWIADLHRATTIARSRGSDADTLRYLEQTLTAFVDVGIAAQSAVLAAESLGYGAVFVGSVRNNPAGISEALGLPEHTFPVVGTAIGRPDPSDTAGIKPRPRPTTVLHIEQYDDSGVLDKAEEYAGAVGEYYRTQGIDYDWLARSTARVSELRAL